MWQSRVGWAIAVFFLCVLTSCLFDLAPLFFFPWLGAPGGFCSGFVPREFLEGPWKARGKKRRSCFLLQISMASPQPYWVPRPPSSAGSFLPGMQAFFLDLRPRASSTSSMSTSVMLSQISAPPRCVHWVLSPPARKALSSTCIAHLHSGTGAWPCTDVYVSSSALVPPLLDSSTGWASSPSPFDAPSSMV